MLASALMASSPTAASCAGPLRTSPQVAKVPTLTPQSASFANEPHLAAGEQQAICSTVPGAKTDVSG